MLQSPVLRRLTRLFRRAALLAVGLALGLAILPHAPLQTGVLQTEDLQTRGHQANQSQAGTQLINQFSLPAATAQRLRVEDIWQQIYQQLPDLPLENQYVNDETGEVSTNNTLVSRLVRYHVYTKGRPTSYRLDWKLTLADYLDANERMNADTYPSGTSLRTNPMAGDKAAINSLSRSQREALVSALVSLFNPNAVDPEPAPSPSATPTPTPQPSPAPPTRFPRQPQPGDAQLLQP